MLRPKHTTAHALLLGLAVVLSARAAEAQLGTSTDEELTDADWNVVELIDDTAGGDAILQGTYRVAGGNPGGFRGLSNGWTHDGDGWSTVAAGHMRAAADFDPSRDGPLGSVELAIDVVTTQTTLPTEAVLVFFPVLRQGETYYAPTSASDSTGGWARAHWGPLAATDFYPIAGDSQGPEHPDFSAAGEPIVFGVSAQSGPHAQAGLYVTEGGIDNWALTLAAPADGGAGGTAGAGGSDGNAGTGAGSGVGTVGPGIQPAATPDREELDCTCRLGRERRRGPSSALWMGVVLGLAGRCRRRW